MVRTTAIALAAILAVAAGAQTARPNFTPWGSIDNMSKINMAVVAVSSQDQDFMAQMAAANWIEIKASELAQTHGSSDWAKHFGKDMLDDHNACQTELVQIAHQQGIELPGDPPMEIQRMYNHLATLDGDAFDAAFRQLQIKGHQQASVLLEQEIRSGENADVKYFAIKTLPTVKQHLKMAYMKDTMTH